jgi:hypothetical protein
MSGIHKTPSISALKTGGKKVPSHPQYNLLVIGREINWEGEYTSDSTAERRAIILVITLQKLQTASRELTNKCDPIAYGTRIANVSCCVSLHIRSTENASNVGQRNRTDYEFKFTLHSRDRTDQRGK